MKPRFKIGDKVCRPEYWGNDVVTIKTIQIHAYSHYSPISPAIDEAPFVYMFEEASHKYKDGAWDYQLVGAEVYHSPLMKALDEN